MPTQFPKYCIVDSVTVLSARGLNPILQDVDLRLATLEALELSWQAAVRTVTDFGLLRINEVLAPMFTEMRAGLNQAGKDGADVTALLDQARAAVEVLTEVIGRYQADCDARIALFKDSALADLAAWKESMKGRLLEAATPPAEFDLIYDPDGRVSKVLEMIAGKRRETEITYHDDGAVATVSSTYDGRRRTETYRYVSGVLAGMTATEDAA